MKLIDKDALVAEIERLKADALQKKSQCKRSGLERIMHQIGAYNKIISFLDTLEVKDVDLESEQRIRECPCRQIVCTMYEGMILECKGACSWVVDYPKLKNLKHRKGNNMKGE